MAFAYLDDGTVSAVRTAALGLGFALDSQFMAATSRISPAFVASFAVGGTGAARLVTLIDKMNTTRALVSGEVPLEEFLKTGIDLAGGADEERVFREALELMSVDGAAQRGVDGPPSVDTGVPPAPVPPAPVPPVDVDAVPATDGALEVMIEEDDTLEVEFLHLGSSASRSVAKLLVHRHFDGQPRFVAGNKPDLALGTGWLIAPGLMITNHHVINARYGFEPPASDGDFALQGSATTAQFDYFADTSAGSIAQSTGCVASDRTLDFALLRLNGDLADRPPFRLRTVPIVRPNDAPLQDRVNVLQHPNGYPMRLGFRNNFVVTGSLEKLSYLTDTDGGSSGAPICDDAWFVAALHRGWRNIPGQPVAIWGKTIHQENYGTPIGLILDYLTEHHPELRAEIQAGQDGIRTA
jgi:hypothetical protein